MRERESLLLFLSWRVLQKGYKIRWRRREPVEVAGTGARNPAGRKHDSATQNVRRERERERDDHRQLLKNALPIIPFLSPLNDRAN